MIDEIMLDLGRICSAITNDLITQLRMCVSTFLNLILISLMSSLYFLCPLHVQLRNEIVCRGLMLLSHHTRPHNSTVQFDVWSCLFKSFTLNLQMRVSDHIVLASWMNVQYNIIT